MPRRRSPLALEFVLLGLLAKQPAHGYEIYKQMNSRCGVFLVWRAKQAQVYALLDKLEGMRLLEIDHTPGESPIETTGAAQAGDQQIRERKSYRLTSAGQQALQEWITRPVLHPREMRQEFLARLYFARQDSPETARGLLNSQRKQCLVWQQDLLAQLRSIETTSPEKNSYERMVFNFRLAQIQAMLGWLEKCQVIS